MTSTQILAASHQQLYDTDFAKWVDRAAELLKQGRFDELDLENLIEEVETLGRSDKKSLRRNRRVLLLHLLKWQQSSQRSGGWKGSIIEHRKRILNTLDDSPSLKNYYISVIEDSYITAREIAAAETGLPIGIFPIECQYTGKQILSKDFWPGH